MRPILEIVLRCIGDAHLDCSLTVCGSVREKGGRVLSIRFINKETPDEAPVTGASFGIRLLSVRVFAADRRHRRRQVSPVSFRQRGRREHSVGVVVRFDRQRTAVFVP